MLNAAKRQASSGEGGSRALAGAHAGAKRARGQLRLESAAESSYRVQGLGFR